VWDGEYRSYLIDGVEMEMFYPGPTHGDGNIAIYFPSSRVLFMVDNVQTGIGYTFFPDHHIEPYTGNMRRLLDLDFDIFIPGHFWLMSRDDFCNSLNLFDTLVEDAKQALIEGCDPTDLGELDRWCHQKLAARYERHFRFHEYIAQNMMRFMHHHLTGGWGVDGATPPAEGPISRGRT
ncbi:MAG: MBL fold metallo-hydrolase, partial [Steroidobacteraceae bacterium]